MMENHIDNIKKAIKRYSQGGDYANPKFVKAFLKEGETVESHTKQSIDYAIHTLKNNAGVK